MIIGSAIPISFHPDWLLPVDGADHSVSLLRFWYTKQGNQRCFADVTNRGLDYVCNAWTIHFFKQNNFFDLMIPGRNYKVHGIDRNTSVLSAADCFLAQIQNTWVKITLQVLHCSNLAFCILLLFSCCFFLITFLCRSYSNYKNKL